MRIAMRALLGLDPDDRGTGALAAREFERALAFYGTEYALRVLRGPRSPWQKMLRAREVLDGIVYREIESRRADGGDREDILGMLMAATDEDGSRLSDREVRDQAVTLLFAGHDTSTSTISFMLYELARNPAELAALVAEQDTVLGQSPATAADLVGRLPRLDMALDETLRLYPPAWIGPRLALQPFEVAGTRVPGGVFVNYCSWASHRLPDVFPRPGDVRPRALLPGAQGRAAEGRLRAVRGRLAHLHRHALRPDGGQGRRDRDPAHLPARAAARAQHDRPPDAHAEPAGWVVDGRSRAGRMCARAGPGSSAVTLV